MKCRREQEAIEKESKVKTAPLKEKQELLLQWMEAKARSEGLKNVPVEGIGTGYWTTHLSATVANATEFWDFVKANQAFDLVETRASSTAVKSYIDGNNTPVPGVTFGQTQVFRVRAANSTSKE
jgi:hypothetical protein